MTVISDKPRAGSVRGFVIFGVAGLVLVLVGSGIFYRYFAHRWWPYFVARTTPSVAQLYELAGGNWLSGNSLDSIVLDRLVVDPGLCRKMEKELVRRFLRPCDEYEVAVIAGMGMYVNQYEIETPDLWWAAYRESVKSNVDMRLRAIKLLAYLTTPKSDEDIPLLIWQCFVQNRDIAHGLLLPHDDPDLTAERRLAHLCVEEDDPRLLSWMKGFEMEADSRGMFNDIIDYYIFEHPHSRYAPAIIKSIGSDQISNREIDTIRVIALHDEWTDEIIRILAKRPDLVGDIMPTLARNDAAIGACLDFMLAHPAHAESVWGGLLDKTEDLALRELSPRWDSIVIQLESESDPACDAVAARVVAKLHFGPALPWLRRQLQRPPAPCTTTVIECLGTMGEPGDFALVYPHVFDQRYQQVAGWALRHLDGAAAREKVVEEIWANPNPGDRLVALSFVCEDEPYGQIIEDPRFHGIGVDSPLVQALLTMGLTSEQHQRVLTLAQ